MTSPLRGSMTRLRRMTSPLRGLMTGFADDVPPRLAISRESFRH
jgi:hypothetical protein